MDKLDQILKPASAPPTDGALEIMRLSLMDWLAVGRAGLSEPIAGTMRDMAADEAGAPDASLFGGGYAPARVAALVNGTISHALDYDDTHFAHIGHPSVVVFPAALSIAQAQGASCDTFLKAALAGAEASVRFGLLFGRGHYQMGYHQTATAGSFGATIAAAHILGLSNQQMQHALGLVSTRASGLKAQFGTMGKPYNAGLAAANGVEAAQLAAYGFVSNPDSVQAFYDTHHCDGSVPTQTGFLMETVQHKFHACCHGLHAALEALKEASRGATDISRIDVYTHPRWLSVCNKPAPTTGLEAKFSYKMALALALMGYDTARLDTFRDDLCVQKDLTDLQDKIHVHGDDSLTEMKARLEVTGAGGMEHAFHDLDAYAPLPDRKARIMAKITSLHGEDWAITVKEMVYGGNPDLGVMADFMQKGP